VNEATGLPQQRTLFRVLWIISLCHLLNDMVQFVLPASYPILAASFHLDFGQVGLITLVYQATASLLQPAVGLYTDHRPKYYALPLGMGFSMLGMLMLSAAPSYALLLLGGGMLGIGSSIFHPESSRVARLASGGRHGLAQSLFQVGGNAGAALGPLLAAFLVLPHGQGAMAWVSLVALFAMLLLAWIAYWQKHHRFRIETISRQHRPRREPLSKRRVALCLGILASLLFSKFVYLAAIGSYYTFYLIERFRIPVQDAQLYLFLFLAANAVGTLAGGPIGDRIGRKLVIWCSILGVLPFTLALPYADLPWTVALSIPIGLILASAFSSIVVYGQDLIPGKTGAVSGVFFGLAFGLSGIGAAALGHLADLYGIVDVYRLCSVLPAIGLLAAFLPKLEQPDPGACPLNAEGRDAATK